MDTNSIGAAIAQFRKKAGLTQAELAAKLNVSDKAVSRWENGLGYPEITQFPALAAIFGITVDRLMMGKRKGITVAGNILVDLVKEIDVYPKIGMLVNISEVTQAVGGCAPNTAIDLAKIDHSIPISVVGKIGDDESGRYVAAQMSRYGIDCGGVTVSASKPTGFSDVMSDPQGERTFFHARGANDEFSPADVDLAALDCSILHIGYILLLGAFDQKDEEYGTVMARFLHAAQQEGIKTSIDVVSSSTADYKSTVLPALKYCNYAFLNEVESSMLTDLPPYNEDGSLNMQNIRTTMEFIASCGVKEKIIVHCKTCGFCLDVPTGTFTAVPSLDIPKDMIRGSVGAGDAFCAGSLYALYNNYDDTRLLEFASTAAAANLFSENSVDGMVPKAELEALMARFPRKSL